MKRVRVSIAVMAK